MGKLWLLGRFVPVWVALDVELAKLGQLLDLCLELALRGDLGSQVIIGLDFTLLNRLLLFLDFLELLL